MQRLQLAYPLSCGMSLLGTKQLLIPQFQVSASGRGCVKSPVSCCRWGNTLRKLHFLKRNPIFRVVSLLKAREKRKSFPLRRYDQSFHTASVESGSKSRQPAYDRFGEKPPFSLEASKPTPPRALSALPRSHGQTWSTVSSPGESTCPNLQQAPGPVILYPSFPTAACICKKSPTLEQYHELQGIHKNRHSLIFVGNHR
jgi:hypothetical protein